MIWSRTLKNQSNNFKNFWPLWNFSVLNVDFFVWIIPLSHLLLKKMFFIWTPAKWLLELVVMHQDFNLPRSTGYPPTLLLSGNNRRSMWHVPHYVITFSDHRLTHDSRPSSSLSSSPLKLSNLSKEQPISYTNAKQGWLSSLNSPCYFLCVWDMLDM